MSTASSSSSTRGTSVITVVSSLPSTSVVASTTTGLPPTLPSTIVDEVAGCVLQSLLRSASVLGGSRAGLSWESGSTAVLPASSSPPVSSGSTGALGMLPLLFFLCFCTGQGKGGGLSARCILPRSAGGRLWGRLGGGVCAYGLVVSADL